VNRLASFLFAIALTLTWASARASAGSLRYQELQQQFEHLTAGFEGRIGVCALDSGGSACVNGDQRFSLQSVMKLIVGIAAMDSVDHRKLQQDDPVLVRRQNLSLYVQPLAKLVGDSGYRTSIGDLVRRSIVDSDSAAADILIGKLGGPQQVQAFLDKKGIRGVRLDRDEKHLQTEIVGLTWRPEYIDAKALDRAIAAVPVPQRTTAYRRYQADPRDTATPRGMASLLQRLATGQLLSAASTGYLMDVMAQTVTFPDRLKAGVPHRWALGHKTGTSGSWQGVTAATNDVGILRAPDGTPVSIAVFIADSRASSAAKTALMAKIAAATTRQYQHNRAPK
jgi:beta-lactamase class A